MQYLSFDIECCDGRHICEFGYVVTDENFHIIKKDCFTIDPEKPFKLIGRKNREDCILSFPEEEYYASPKFPAFYTTISNLLTSSETLIFGYSLKNDVCFLKNACIKYGLPLIEFDFIDGQILYSDFSGTKKCVSLEAAETALNLKKPYFLHKSDDDALRTIELVKTICIQLNSSVSELMKLYPTVCGKSHNYNIQYTGNDLQSMINALEKNPNTLSQNRKKKCIQEFAKAVVPQGPIIRSCLNNKSLCFSVKFEMYNAVDTLKLIQILANHGCKYNTKVSENNYYIAFDEELISPPTDKYTRYYAALQKDDGRDLSIISFEKLFSLINFSYKELRKFKLATTSDYRMRSPFSEKLVITIGDQLRAQGIII